MFAYAAVVAALVDPTSALIEQPWLFAPSMFERPSIFNQTWEIEAPPPLDERFRVWVFNEQGCPPATVTKTIPETLKAVEPCWLEFLPRA